MQLLNTLYITTEQSYAHLDNETLRVDVAHETRLRVPLHHLSAVVCLGMSQYLYRSCISWLNQA